MIATVASGSLDSAPSLVGNPQLSSTMSDASNHATVVDAHPRRNAPIETSQEISSDIYSVGGYDLSFTLPKCELPPVAEFQPVEVFVHKTVMEQNQQINDNAPLKPYKGILDALRTKSDLSLVAKILLALRTSGKGATLHMLATGQAKHARLIHQIVRFHPFEVKTEAHKENDTEEAQKALYAVADAHLHLLLALVSANSVYLIPTLTAWWKLLALEYENVSTQRTQRLHAAIASLLRLCPKGKSEILPIITANAPYRTRPEDAIAWYYQHALTVLQYLPAIHGPVLEFIVDKCLELDVEIKICDSGDVTIDDEPKDSDDVNDIFTLDEDEPKPIPQQAAVDVTVDEMANKLDSLMMLLFEYSKREAPAMSIQSFYDVYARAFESSVLITHKSKFVQFLLFFVCGLDAAQAEVRASDNAPLYRIFVAKLMTFVVDPYRATVTRQTAACYLASFVSRASFVSVETVAEAVAALLDWAAAYLQSLEGTNAMLAADSKGQCSSHALFYTVCQAAFYMMCFRGPEALSFAKRAESNVSLRSGRSIDISPLRWQSMCSSPMQPLRYCLESVRSEFLQLSRVFGLLDSATLEKLLHDNTRSVTASRKKKSPMKIATAATLEKERKSGGVGGLGQGTNPLESFFPFDPYLLRHSHIYIEPYYCHWPGSIEERMTDIVVDEESDDDSVTAGDTDEGGESSESENSDRELDEDDGEEDLDVIEPMSLVSSGAGILDDLSHDHDDIMTIEDQQRMAWAAMLKRDRAPSLEHGSW